MNATEHFRAGHLSEAIQALTEEVRQSPLDVKRRTFLFELLCFAGEYDRAERQLDALTGENQQNQMGALLYRAALAAERVRQRFFEQKDYLQHAAVSDQLTGTINGKPFSSLSDADARIGARLEVLAGGDYLWIPLDQISSIAMQPPRRLRDLLWVPALVRTAEHCSHRDMGEVFIPVVYPGSARHADQSVRLGRSTVFEDVGGNEVPFGQKIFVADDEETPLLEIRELTIAQAKAASQ